MGHLGTQTRHLGLGHLGKQGLHLGHLGTQTRHFGAQILGILHSTVQESPHDPQELLPQQELLNELHELNEPQLESHELLNEQDIFCF